MPATKALLNSSDSNSRSNETPTDNLQTGRPQSSLNHCWQDKNPRCCDIPTGNYPSWGWQRAYSRNWAHSNCHCCDTRMGNCHPAWAKGQCRTAGQEQLSSQPT